MSITLTQLSSFVAVVRTGSVTAAADELVVTQPSVSAAITGLARELGHPLIEREGRGVRPTAAGAAFAPYASHVIGLLDDGRRETASAASASGRELRIAAVTTAAESFVPALMHRFASEQGEVRLKLEVGNRDVILAMVSDHTADVAFLGQPPRKDRIEALPMWCNELVLITAPDDPLSQRRQVPAAELANRHWLLREPGSGTRAYNEDYLASAALDPPTLRVGSNGAIKQAARAGLGVALVSREALPAELDAGLLATIDVTPPPPPRTWHVIRSSVGPSRPVVAAFLEFIREAVAEP